MKAEVEFGKRGKTEAGMGLLLRSFPFSLLIVWEKLKLSWRGKLLRP